jgi:drug/metabolite transporter (DMT)-like permease
MSLNDWLLFLHVLSAFILVAAEVLFTFLIAWLWRREVPSDIARVWGISRFGNVLVGVGAMGVLILGIVLAFEADSYAIWDAWIVAAIVLWLAYAELGRRTGKVYAAAGARARMLVSERRDEPNPELGAMFRSRAGLGFHLASVAVVLLLLLDMIFKPGA